jgi:hypothetical protein
MRAIIKTFQQEPWHKVPDVSIHEGAIISMDGLETQTDREQALAWIILRLNAQVLALKSAQANPVYDTFS